MSVIRFEGKEFDQIAATLKTPHHRDSFFTSAERYEGQDYCKACELSIDQYTDQQIDYFVNRLLIANTVAYAYNYGEKIEPPERNGSTLPVTNRNLLDTLCSLHYNLYTNNGRAFLGKDDEEKLEVLIYRLQREVIADLDEVVERLQKRAGLAVSAS